MYDWEFGIKFNVVSCSADGGGGNTFSASWSKDGGVGNSCLVIRLEVGVGGSKDSVSCLLCKGAVNRFVVKGSVDEVGENNCSVIFFLVVYLVSVSPLAGKVGVNWFSVSCLEGNGGVKCGSVISSVGGGGGGNRFAVSCSKEGGGGNWFITLLLESTGFTLIVSKMHNLFRILPSGNYWTSK